MRSARTNGYTVVEILTAIAIMALLAAIAVPLYRNYIADTRTVDAISALEAVKLEVRVPAEARNGLQVCDNSLVHPENLDSDYLDLGIGASPNDLNDPSGDLGFAAILMVTATLDKHGPTGIAVAKTFHEELQNQSSQKLIASVVTDSVVSFGVTLSVPGVPFCDPGATAAVAKASSGGNTFNRLPVAGQNVDLGKTLEDTALKIDTTVITNAGWDPDGDTLTVSAVSASNGSISGDASSGFTYTPGSDFKGVSKLSYDLSDGTGSVKGTANIQVTSVTDAAAVTLRAQVERVAFGLQGGRTEGWIRPVGDNLDTGGDLGAFTAEFVYAHDPSIHIGQYQDFAAYGTGDHRISLWTGGTYLNLSSPGGTVSTDINMNDGNDHRVTLTWSATDHVARVYDNGVLVKEVPAFLRGKSSLDGNGPFNAGSKYTPGEYGGTDQFVGKLLSLGMVSHALGADEISRGPVYSTTDKNSGLLFDLRSTPATGRIEDQTGRNRFELQNEKLTPNQLSDVGSTTPGAGDKLHIHYTVTAPKDPEDKITNITLTGFNIGSVVQGPAGPMTSAPLANTIDLTGSFSGTITATLPATASNTRLTLVAITTGPDGQTKMIATKLPITMDASSSP